MNRHKACDEMIRKLHKKIAKLEMELFDMGMLVLKMLKEELKEMQNEE